MGFERDVCTTAGSWGAGKSLLRLLLSLGLINHIRHKAKVEHGLLGPLVVEKPHNGSKEKLEGKKASQS